MGQSEPKDHKKFYLVSSYSRNKNGKEWCHLLSGLIKCYNLLRIDEVHSRQSHNIIVLEIINRFCPQSQ